MFLERSNLCAIKQAENVAYTSTSISGPKESRNLAINVCMLSDGI
ncbi:hypothetical protein SMB34_16885 [Thalassospira permensis NBRC 106175]|uniref:Uncharacterized protein n=1 Tax=Thalassospira permensis NBRC 106175 TaxID=1353532 RepID=A0ABR4TPD8_9PROT|nr:hypothetical protein SMB34_16885 [Thalassospira permensis NBRC 106175]